MLPCSPVGSCLHDPAPRLLWVRRSALYGVWYSAFLVKFLLASLEFAGLDRTPNTEDRTQTAELKPPNPNTYARAFLVASLPTKAGVY